MKKDKLTKAVADNKATTKEALQLLYDNVNKGQRKQLVKKEEIKNLFDLYGVDYEE